MNQGVEIIGKLINLRRHVLGFESFQQVDGQRPQAAHKPTHRLTFGLHTILGQSNVPVVVHDFYEPVLANGIEKLFGFSLSSGTCVADVVTRLLAYLIAIQVFADTNNHNAGTHPGLAPPSRQRVSFQAVAGVGALVETSVAAFRLVDPLVGRPAGKAVADAVPVQVGLVRLEADQIHAFGPMDGLGRFRRQVKGVQSDLLTA